MVDRKIREATSALGSLGEARQLLLASLLLADELKEQRSATASPDAPPPVTTSVADVLEDLASASRCLPTGSRVSPAHA
jgi:cell division protein ZapA